MDEPIIDLVDREEARRREEERKRRGGFLWSGGRSAGTVRLGASGAGSPAALAGRAMEALEFGRALGMGAGAAAPGGSAAVLGTALPLGTLARLLIGNPWVSFALSGLLALGLAAGAYSILNDEGLAAVMTRKAVFPTNDLLAARRPEAPSAAGNSLHMLAEANRGAGGGGETAPGARAGLESAAPAQAEAAAKDAGAAADVLSGLAGAGDPAGAADPARSDRLKTRDPVGERDLDGFKDSVGGHGGLGLSGGQGASLAAAGLLGAHGSEPGAGGRSSGPESGTTRGLKTFGRGSAAGRKKTPVLRGPASPARLADLRRLQEMSMAMGHSAGLPDVETSATTQTQEWTAGDVPGTAITGAGAGPGPSPAAGVPTSSMGPGSGGGSSPGFEAPAPDASGPIEQPAPGAPDGPVIRVASPQSDAPGSPEGRETPEAAPEPGGGKDVTPWKGLARLAQGMLVAAGVIIGALAIASKFTASPAALWAAPLTQILFTSANLLAMAVAGIGAKLMMDGQRDQGLIFAVSGALTAASSTIALKSPGAMRMFWPLLIGGVAPIAGAITSVLLMHRLPAEPLAHSAPAARGSAPRGVRTRKP